MEQNTENTVNVKISEDVIATIAGVSATEIDGVASLTKTLSSELKGLISNKRNDTKGIKVEMLPEGKVNVDIFINVYYGKKIPEIAESVQRNVYKNLSSMTGYIVEKINVTVTGIIFEKTEDKPEK